MNINLHTRVFRTEDQKSPASVKARAVPLYRHLRRIQYISDPGVESIGKNLQLLAVNSLQLRAGDKTGQFDIKI